MANSYWIIERLLTANESKQIQLPPATKAFLQIAKIKAHAVPPDLSLTDATVIEVLHRTYFPEDNR
jgi:hypothetical protein